MKIRYNKKNLYYLFLVLPFFFPTAFAGAAVGTLIKGYKIIVGLIIVFYMLKKHEMSPLLLLLSSFYGIVCVSALWHGLEIDNWIIQILFLWLINYLTHDWQSLKRFLHIYVNLYSVLMLINLATMIIFPNGLYSSSAYNLNWFLGYKNVIIRLLLPYLALMLVENVIDNGTLKFTKTNKLLFAATIISILLSKSFNSWIGMAIFLILIWRIKANKPLTKYMIAKSFVLYCATDFAMLKLDFLSVFQNLIVNVLEKNASERGRLAIWNRTLELIPKSPFTGYGGITNEMYNIAFKVSHPHNLLLYYLMLGGIVGVIILLFSMILTEQTSEKRQEKKTIIVNRIIADLYVAYFAMGYLESLTGAIMMIPMLVVMYNINSMRMGSDADENRIMHTI